MKNLFWPVYKNLESELLSLTYHIHFDDSQLKVYSEKFIDLLLRASIEIEALSKQLYLDNGGSPVTPESDMFFDTVCLNYLEERWSLSKKVVSITGINFFFENEENISITPLKKANKRGSSGAKWKQAYQMVKHNRNNNYIHGNMKNCVSAIGALYVLNLYNMYKDQRISIGKRNTSASFDRSFGSAIFTPRHKYVSFTMPSGEFNEQEYEDCVFVDVFDNTVFNRALQEMENDLRKQREFLRNSIEFQNFIAANPEYDFSGKHYLSIAALLGQDFATRFNAVSQNALRTILTSDLFCVLNCNQQFYTKE